MPFKKLSRRTFLTASSALAFLHTSFARAIPAPQSVNINDYNPHDWIASFKQAFSEGQTVVVPAGLVCDNINTGIFIPPGKTLHILGSLCGNGRGRFVLQDGSQVTGKEGGSMHNITLDVRGSDCTIKGLAMSGFGPVTQIYIGGKKTNGSCATLPSITSLSATLITPSYAGDFITRLSVPTSPTVSSATYRATLLNGTWRFTTVIF